VLAVATTATASTLSTGSAALTAAATLSAAAALLATAAGFAAATFAAFVTLIFFPVRHLTLLVGWCTQVFQLSNKTNSNDVRLHFFRTTILSLQPDAQYRCQAK